MKRNYLFKNMGRVSLIIGLLATTLLSSCMKDNSPGSIDFSKSPALVGFQYKGFSAVPMLTKLFAQPNQVRAVEITLSVASLTLKTPVTVTVGLDAAGEANYKKTVDSNANVLPASEYTIANGGVITIQPGQQIVKLNITYAADKIDFSQDYILGLKINSVTGGPIIASNLSNIILTIALQSIYEGEYVATGSFTDVKTPSITDDGIFPENIDLLTVSPFVVDYYDLTYNVGYGTPITSSGTTSYYWIFSPEFDFDPAGTGKIVAVVNAYGQHVPPHGRSGRLDVSGVNASTGTPGTVGFKIQVKFVMVQDDDGGDRTFYNETYTYIGPAQ